MVTKIRSGARGHLYIEEWMAKRDVRDEAVANRIGVARETVTRWRRQHHRLNPEKIAALASALDLEPIQLWSPPSRPSVDALLKGASDEMVQKVVEMAAILRRAG